MCEEDEEFGMELEISSDALPSISSNYWQIEQIYEPGMLYFDCSSLPASPMADLILWNHHHHHHHDHGSGTRQLKLKLLMPSFKRMMLLEEICRGMIGGLSFYRTYVKKLPTRWRLFPQSGQEGVLVEITKIAVRFEEKIYTAATSQTDYLRKISLKMLTMESKSLNPVCDETVQVVDESSKVQLDAKSPLEESTPMIVSDSPKIDYCYRVENVSFDLSEESEQHRSTLHNLQSGKDSALLDPFQQGSVTEHGKLKRKGDTGPSGQDHTIFELGNKQKMDKKLKKTWGIGGSICLDDLKQHFGKKREEAAESLDVSVSTIKRICRENGISRWPSKKIKRDRVLLSNLSCYETVPVADGPRISISTTPTAFASTYALVNSNQQKSRSSNLSVHKETGTSLNDDVLRNDEGTDEENIMIQEGDSANREVLYEPQELEPACDGTSHLEKQYLGRERLSCNSGKEVIVSVEGSSSYNFRNVSETNQDYVSAAFASHCEVDKDHLISMDDLESNCIKAQSTLESISEPSLQNDARRMKLIFDKLIMLPLEDLVKPNHEASMKEALIILTDNLSLLRDEQAKQLLEYKFDFPTITYSWRDCSQSRIDCQNFLAEFENTKTLLETSTKEEDDLKDRYTQLENKEKEMMEQLEAIQKDKNDITKRRSENFNQTKHLTALAEEQAGRTKEKELQMTIASDKLDKLKRQYVSLQSSFNN